MKRFEVEVSRAGYRISASVQQIGEDILVSIWGGTRPHIGAVAMAAPRPSLKDPGKWSATSSNFTFLNHKEDMLVKKVSEELSSRLRTNVVVVAGLHWDDLTSRGIRVVEALSLKIPDLILRKIKAPSRPGGVATRAKKPH